MYWPAAISTMTQASILFLLALYGFCFLCIVIYRSRSFKCNHLFWSAEGTRKLCSRQSTSKISKCWGHRTSPCLCYHWGYSWPGADKGDVMQRGASQEFFLFRRIWWQGYHWVCCPLTNEWPLVADMVYLQGDMNLSFVNSNWKSCMKWDGIFFILTPQQTQSISTLQTCRKWVLELLW